MATTAGCRAAPHCAWARPPTPGQKLYLRGACPDEQLKAGPLPVTVTVEGVTLPPTVIRPGENAFELAFPLPDSLVGKGRRCA